MGKGLLGLSGGLGTAAVTGWMTADQPHPSLPRILLRHSLHFLYKSPFNVYLQRTAFYRNRSRAVVEFVHVRKPSV